MDFCEGRFYLDYSIIIKTYWLLSWLKIIKLDSQKNFLNPCRDLYRKFQWYIIDGCLQKTYSLSASLFYELIFQIFLGVFKRITVWIIRATNVSGSHDLHRHDQPDLLSQRCNYKAGQGRMFRRSNIYVTYFRL